MRDWKPATMKPIDGDSLRRALGKSIFGRNVLVYETLPSTNTLARELGCKGAPEGTLVLCEEQTAGKGRMGRQWHSPRYANLLFSILLRPSLPTERVFVLTMVFALAGAEAIEESSGVRPSIKWPNDIMVGRKKLGGILTEFSAGAGKLDQVVLGLGLNVHWNPKPEEWERYPATCVRAESGRDLSREELLVNTVVRFEAHYRSALSGSIDGVRERWNKRSMLLGRQITVDTGRGTIRGKALGIDEMGALILRDGSGEIRRITNGDVSLQEIGA